MFPNQMQTGFSVLQEASKPDEELLNYLQNLLLIFAEKSIFYGSHYAKCAGRDNLSGMDTLYALQYMSHEFLNLEDLPESIAEKLSESESDIDTESDTDNEEEDDVFTRASDEDPICKKMNDYHDNWDSWTPVDDIQILLKQNVDKTINTINN